MKRLVRFALASLSLASASLAFPALAQAADGYVTGNVTMRAGPDAGYPLIDRIPAGTEVNVQGCTEGWEWCDVIVYGNRGWVAGNYIEYEYQDRPVLLPSYGAQIGIPIVTFVIGTYWDNYYRSRPFYRQRTQWYHRPVVRRPPPPPLRHPYRPPVHGAPGHGRPPANRPQPPATTRPTPQRSTGPTRPVQGNRPPQPTRPAQPGRPSQPARPAEPGRPPQPVRPAQSNRPSQPAHPAQPNRPQMGRPAQAAGHAQPAKPGKAGPAGKKDDQQGH